MPLKNLKETIENFPRQFQNIASEEIKKKLPPSLQKIIVCGMGGSGLPGELIQLFESSIPIEVRKNYAPAQFLPQAGVICISYSGNTEETLSCYQKAIEQDIPVIAITTDGKLKQKAQKEGNLVQIPKTNIQPRWASGLLLGALYIILKNSQILSESPSKESLKKIPQQISPLDCKKRGKKIASFIKNKIPLIYTSTQNRPLGYYWKIAINENTKRHAFNNVFPEMNHNEIEGYKNQGAKSAPIIIKDKNDLPKIKKRMSKFKEVLSQRNIETKTVKLAQKNTFEKIAQSIIAANWTVYHLAQAEKTDPEPVKLIEKFKKLMKN